MENKIIYKIEPCYSCQHSFNPVNGSTENCESCYNPKTKRSTGAILVPYEVINNYPANYGK